MSPSEFERKILDLFPTARSIVSGDEIEPVVGLPCSPILTEIPDGGYVLTPIYRKVWADYQDLKAAVVAVGPPKLSEAAEAVLSFSKSTGRYFGLKENAVTQELLDATLIERITYFGQPAFRTTEAGKEWGRRS